MKKMIAVLLLIIVISSSTSCDKPTQNYSSPQISKDGPSNNILNLGNVTILLGGPGLRSLEPKRQEEILAAVSQCLIQDRNVRVTFQAISDINLNVRLNQLLAAGTPPSICVYRVKATNPDQKTKDTLSETNPLPLSRSIDQYGQNLRREIPQYIWDSITVNGQIMEIPQLQISISMPVLNENVLLRQKWQIPKTVDEFEALLESAKEKNIFPVVASRTFSSSMPWIQATRTSTIVKNGDVSVHYLASVQYLAWLQQQRKWIENDWLVDLSKVTEEDLLPDSEKWLCTDMTLEELSGSPNVVILPPLSNDGSIPVYPNPYQSLSSFVSYAEPDALVILFDWMISSESNNRLITVGEEGKDYRMINESEYEWIDGPSWPGSNFFKISAIFHTPHFVRKNESAYEKALDICSKYSLTSSSSGIPGSAIKYCKNGSRLDTAINDEFKFHKLAIDAGDRYLAGEITMSDYQAVLEQNKALIKDYIQISEDMQAGRYNIWNDVIQP